MLYIFRKVRLRYVFLLYLFISCLSYQVLAKNEANLSTEDKKEILDTFHDSVFSTDFNNNDKLKNYKTRGLFILDYLNAIVSRILDNNKDILSKYGFKKEDIKIGFLIKNQGNAYAEIKKIMLVLSECDLFNTNMFTTDAYIEAMLSHEIAHILLSHVKQDHDLIDILFKEFVSIQEKDPDFKKEHQKPIKSIKDLDSSYRLLFKNYYESHPNYLNLRKKHEIEADDLGLKLYSNAGCNTECFADSFIDFSRFNQERNILWVNYYLIKDALLKISEGSSYPNDSNSSKIRSMFTRYHKQIGNRVEDYKYTYDPNGFFNTWNDPTGHPTHLWRFWNLFKQEQDISNEIKIKSKNITTTEYIKMDLSKFKGLNYVKSLLQEKAIPDTPLNLHNMDDPRVYISGAFLTDGTNITYKLYSSTQKEDVGIIKNDNTITLKANDVFRVAGVSLAQDINKLDTSCTGLFSRNAERIEQGIYTVTKYTTIIMFVYYVLLKMFGTF